MHGKKNVIFNLAKNIISKIDLNALMYLGVWFKTETAYSFYFIMLEFTIVQITIPKFSKIKIMAGVRPKLQYWYSNM